MRSVPWAAAAIAVLILLASAPQPHAGAQAKGSHPTAALSLSPRAAAPRPSSMGLSGDLPSAPARVAPSYDEQLGATFTQNFTSLAYNVTALAQSDADGYGPAYLLNGLTPAGYWYQAGISYHWPDSSGTYDPTFGFSYQVYGPTGKTVYPVGGGAGLGNLSAVVHSGDSVLISLTFTGSAVQMVVKDWDTGATAEVSYSSEGSSTFVGDPFSSTSSQGFFTGLMTEWYHAAPYSGNEGKVTYTNSVVALTSAWMWIDEFNGASTAPPLFSNETQSPVVFANDHEVYPFSADGATMYVSAHEFVTGLAEEASTLTLTPATPAPTGASPLAFTANYTLAGQQQNSTVAPGVTMLQADPGTMITIAVAPTGTSEMWVFSTGASENEVTFAAGTNATFVYYLWAEQTVSYQVADQGQAIPASSAPELTYEEPPLVASATPAPVAVTRALGTTPTVIVALVNSVASVNASIPGAPGERWAAPAQNWTIYAPNFIPDPIPFYQQFEVSARYSVVGGGAPPQTPEFNSTAFGGTAVIHLSNESATGWFDAGTAYSFTKVLNGSIPTERWQQVGGGASASVPVSLDIVSAPNEKITADYVHQYYADLGVNVANGGVVSGTFSGVVGNGSVRGPLTQGPGWLDAGLSLNASASANQGWQFESWSGSGASSYSGTNPSLEIAVAGPLSENATFYPQLTISADGGTDVGYSYGSETGTVQAGTTKTLYVPPSSDVSLRATPSLFVYSFSSWKGTGLAGQTKPTLAIVVDSPSAVKGTSSYNYPVVLVAAVAAAIILLAVSLWILNLRRRRNDAAF